MSGVSTDEMASAAGSTLHRVYHWMDRGVIRPGAAGRRGYGNPVRWTTKDVAIVRVLEMLRESGQARFEFLADVVRRLERTGDWVDAVLVLVRGHALVVPVSEVPKLLAGVEGATVVTVVPLQAVSH